MNFARPKIFLIFLLIVTVIFFFPGMFYSVYGEKSLDHIRVQGNAGKLWKLNLISVANAIKAGNGVIKVQTASGVAAADLVLTTDANASPVRVRTPVGTRAWAVAPNVLSVTYDVATKLLTIRFSSPVSTRPADIDWNDIAFEINDSGGLDIQLNEPRGEEPSEEWKKGTAYSDTINLDIVRCYVSSLSLMLCGCTVGRIDGCSALKVDLVLLRGAFKDQDGNTFSVSGKDDVTVTFLNCPAGCIKI